MTPDSECLGSAEVSRKALVKIHPAFGGILPEPRSLPALSRCPARLILPVNGTRERCLVACGVEVRESVCGIAPQAGAIRCMSDLPVAINPKGLGLECSLGMQQSKRLRSAGPECRLVARRRGDYSSLAMCMNAIHAGLQRAGRMKHLGHSPLIPEGGLAIVEAARALRPLSESRTVRRGEDHLRTRQRPPSGLSSRRAYAVAGNLIARYSKGA